MEHTSVQPVSSLLLHVEQILMQMQILIFLLSLTLATF